jgi:hypothetical protein
LQGKTQHWRGKLFVFDDRLVVPIRKPTHGEQKEEEDVIRWDCGGGCRVRFQYGTSGKNLSLENSSSYIFGENILLCSRLPASIVRGRYPENRLFAKKFGLGKLLALSGCGWL